MLCLQQDGLNHLRLLADKSIESRAIYKETLSILKCSQGSLFKLLALFG
jgi:hypothetical protein